ncbi:hypothetical protein [Nocardioides sp. 1609]|uniref:hypothetical protein n=1 Tax=Nocardioides sp. 1609 TaxID=2508327 RepID=UPI00106F57EC|nr:hypothetical protein [Nocardioides sp. 1609]
MTSHRAPTPRRYALRDRPVVPLRRVLLLGTSSLLTATGIAAGMVATATVGPGESALRVDVEPVSLPARVAPPTPTSSPVAEALDPPVVLDDEDAPVPVASALPRLGEEHVRDVPPVAVAAYERAASVVADPRVGCHVRWTTLAAVARVESDHGRRGGADLDEEGRAAPAVHGVALDGEDGRDRPRDTDRGKVDGLGRWDRTSGPAGFLPTEWAVYGVDADDDGRRDVQDVDDAALALAVRLCGTALDLDAHPALQAALTAHRPSRAYVRQVLRVARAYAADVREQDAAPTADLPVVVVHEPVVEDEPGEPTDEPTDEPTEEPTDEPTVPVGSLGDRRPGPRR